MDGELTDVPAMRLGYIRTDMSRPGDAWMRLIEVASAAGLTAQPNTTLAAFPVEVIQGAGQSPSLPYDAAFVLADDAELPDGLEEERVPAGRFVSWTYTGPYDDMGAAWGEFTAWFGKSGHQTRPGLCYEMYRNSPMDTAPADLRTDLYIPIA